jgi:hypothetical protein
MDGLIATQKNFPVLMANFRGEKTDDRILAGECRDLITALSQKVEALCRECGEDFDQVTHIRSLAPSLIVLNSPLKALEEERPNPPGSRVLEDIQGIRYIAVRHCELERWFNEK